MAALPMTDQELLEFFKDRKDDLVPVQGWSTTWELTLEEMFRMFKLLMNKGDE